MLCVFWHRSSVELDSRHSQHSSVSLGQPCLCCQFTGYPWIDIMNTGKIPPQDVFKEALTPISKLSIHWSLSLTSSGFNPVADWPQESFFIYFCSNLWPGLSSSSLDCSSPTRSPIAWFAEFFSWLETFLEGVLKESFLQTNFSNHYPFDFQSFQRLWSYSTFYTF